MRFVIGLLSASCWMFAGRTAFSQIPERFENLRVLPDDIDRKELLETMRGFSFELGTRCEHCHVGGPALDTMNFASDEKEAKRTARRMLTMVRVINEEHLAKLEESKLEVTCFTCHRGVVRPEPIESIVEETIHSAGLDAAIARYRELRADYFGSGSYDFGVTPLNRLGERLLDAGAAGMAVAVLELNAEYHRDSAWLHDVLGEAYLQTGDRERARASFEKSLSLNPKNSRTRQKLEELQHPGPR